ncbi:MAG: 23S rRNA (guanosine(2251)-2'-O)-methyltransferase RlmB [Flavobacteriales bacterium]|nr:MAG: 23S rRNA (guanosine(2251)-2'-O)-methyltransferase RlmB [Flavobacteriales bacterium]
MNDKKDDLIFGIHPVIEAIQSGKTIDKVFVQNRLRGENYDKLKKVLGKHKISPNFVPVEKLNRLTRKNHQGVVAFVTDVPVYKIEELLPQILEEKENPLFLILDHITDVRNFGAICRTAECVGVDAIIIPEKGTAPINGVAIKTSTGALYNVKVCKEKHLSHTLDYLQQNGVEVFAASEKAEKSIYETDFTQEPCAIIMGNEEKGVSKDLLHHCDEKIKLPIIGKTQSLNVSVACGAVLYEIFRQKMK